MAAKKKLTPQQQRDRRAKLMLAVLGVVLLAVLGFQLPSMLKGSGTSSAPPPAPAPASATPGAAGVGSPAPSQLASFSRFAPKDPFKPGVRLAGSTSPTSTTPAAPAPAPAPKPKPAVKPKKTTPQVTISVSQQPTTPAVPTVPAALVLVDGKKHVLALDEGFPQKKPFFKVVALSDKAVWVELVGGTLTNGQQTVKLDRGRRVTLLDATAGIRLVLVMVKPTTAPKLAVAPPTTTTTGG